MMSGIHALFNKMADVWAPRDYLLLFLRAWVAKVFFVSGRTKVGDEFLTPTETTLFLFEDEYALPIINHEVAAYMALYAETFLPIMLWLGLGTRFAALGLMGMALTIQVFVYPASFPEHATWIAALLPLAMMGPGKISLDQLFVRHFNKQ